MLRTNRTNEVREVQSHIVLNSEDSITKSVTVDRVITVQKPQNKKRRTWNKYRKWVAKQIATTPDHMTEEAKKDGKEKSWPLRGKRHLASCPKTGMGAPRAGLFRVLSGKSHAGTSFIHR